MGLGNPPAFVGKTVITSDNNELYWTEQTSGANNATLNTGEYYPDALATAISAAMNAASIAGNTYAAIPDLETGFWTVTRLAGTEDFAMDARSSQAGNLWTGGTADTQGNTWSTDQYGPNFLGWPIAAAITSYASSHTSPEQGGGVWYPSQPAQDDDSGADSGMVAQAYALDGTMNTYNFAGWLTSNEDAHFPRYLGKNQVRAWTFQYITQASRNQYIQWWGAYAKSGGAFRFYPDYTDNTVYYEYKLTKESCEARTFLQRTTQGYPYYTGTITARGAA